MWELLHCEAIIRPMALQQPWRRPLSPWNVAILVIEWNNQFSIFWTILFYRSCLHKKLIWYHNCSDGPPPLVGSVCNPPPCSLSPCPANLGFSFLAWHVYNCHIPEICKLLISAMISLPIVNSIDLLKALPVYSSFEQWVWMRKLSRKAVSKFKNDSSALAWRSFPPQ